MESKKTILELYEFFIDNIYTNTVESSKHTDKINKLEDELEGTFTKEQKNKYEEISICYQKRNEEIYKKIWTSAYSKATKLIAEGLKE